MMPLHISRGHHSKMPENNIFLFILPFLFLFFSWFLFSDRAWAPWLATENWVLKNYYKRINGALNAERGAAREKGGTRLRIKYRNIIKVKQLIYEKKKRYALEATAKAPNVAQFSMLPHATPQTPNYYQPAEPDWPRTGWLVAWLVGWVVEWLSSWMAEWMAGWLADWLPGWLAGINAFWYESVL